MLYNRDRLECVFTSFICFKAFDFFQDLSWCSREVSFTHEYAI